MNKKHSEVKITVSPSSIERKLIRDEYQSKTGSDNFIRKNREVYDEIYNRFLKEISLEDVSLNEAQAFAESIRIAYPDQCISLAYGKLPNSGFIGNTTWNDQLRMFFEYETYTPIGKRIMEKRKAEANAQGIEAA
jgi:isocitrate lyase